MENKPKAALWRRVLFYIIIAVQIFWFLGTLILYVLPCSLTVFISAFITGIIIHGLVVLFFHKLCIVNLKGSI